MWPLQPYPNILLPIKSPVGSAVFKVSLFEAVFKCLCRNYGSLGLFDTIEILVVDSSAHVTARVYLSLKILLTLLATLFLFPRKSILLVYW